MSQVSRRVSIFNKTRQSFLATNAVVANTYLSRLIGLLGQTPKWVREGQGLWIVPSRGVHTIGMMFSLDLVFLTKDKEVVHVEERVPPFRISKVLLKAHSVLELPPEAISRSGTQVGDALEIGVLEAGIKPARETAILSRR
jgi:uncharacterized membrane protein (UPF0127 family)